jgi:hypothetical protein
MRRLAAIPLALMMTLAMTLFWGAASAGEGTGSFGGLNGHRATGQAMVVKTADGWEVHLNDNFTFDGAPDPWVGFGTSGNFARTTDFYRLRSNSGAQVYKVPADIDPAAYGEVYIWCRRYSVPLGVAEITN